MLSFGRELQSKIFVVAKALEGAGAAMFWRNGRFFSVRVRFPG